ncbi:trimeric virion coat protein rifampicin res [Mythimna separata entomopoxvirus 'L']|uniref:62 kDa protein n=1 Tax=Mythimna separata entomopoxvirus 'L' TaxID=1293572 RepID=A0A916KQD0_9POXV|nr:trimeric virion coat protein rifampicin res [Mythimna separata entomopoxvirus 'L']CCU56374.1 trimeric virion coat protein rifampicin res [Mythimna separata entomopoxvirus 'L']
MKRSCIAYSKTNIDSDRQNIYITETKNGKYNIPQQFICPCTFEDGYAIASVTDNKLEGCNNFGLNITLPEIKGIGGVRYQTDFTYKLIEECIIETIDDNVKYNTIIKKTGLEFLMDFNQKRKEYSNYIGNNIDMCTFKYGKCSDDIIFPSKDIYFPLSFIFDNSNMNPRTCFRLYPETKLQIKIKFRPFSSILLPDAKYKKHSLKNITDVDLQPYIKFTGYNTCGSPHKHRYIEELITSTHQSNKKNYYTPDFLSITNILWYSRTDVFSGNMFISYPDYPETEENFIKTFIDKIIPDLIIISDNDDFLKSRGFNEKCKFKKLKPYDEIKFDVNNSCIINIMNIPETHDIYYHTNILSFSRRNNPNEYNISKKFNYILGTYIPDEDKIIIHEIKHTINISDISIPINIWNADENTATGDLRSSKSKKNDIYVDDPFVFGLDFLSKELGIISRSISSSANESIAEFNSDIVSIDAYFPSDCLYAVSSTSTHSNPSIFLYRFNLHNIIFVEPSRLIADVGKNFRCVNLAVDWKEFSEVDPRSLFNKKLHICMTIVKKISYDNNIISVHTLE